MFLSSVIKTVVERLSGSTPATESWFNGKRPTTIQERLWCPRLVPSNIPACQALVTNFAARSSVIGRPGLLATTPTGSHRGPATSNRFAHEGAWRFVELQALDARTSDRTERLTKLPGERTDKEATDVTAIFNELQTAIQDQLNDPDIQQGFLPRPYSGRRFGPGPELISCT
jgi:hypothetical protein